MCDAAEACPNAASACEMHYVRTHATDALSAVSPAYCLSASYDSSKGGVCLPLDTLPSKETSATAIACGKQVRIAKRYFVSVTAAAAAGWTIADCPLVCDVHHAVLGYTRLRYPSVHTGENEMPVRLHEVIHNCCSTQMVLNPVCRHCVDGVKCAGCYCHAGLRVYGRSDHARALPWVFDGYVVLAVPRLADDPLLVDEWCFPAAAMHTTAGSRDAQRYIVDHACVIVNARLQTLVRALQKLVWSTHAETSTVCAGLLESLECSLASVSLSGLLQSGLLSSWEQCFVFKALHAYRGLCRQTLRSYEDPSRQEGTRNTSTTAQRCRLEWQQRRYQVQIQRVLADVVQALAQCVAAMTADDTANHDDYGVTENVADSAHVMTTAFTAAFVAADACAAQRETTCLAATADDGADAAKALLPLRAAFVKHEPMKLVQVSATNAQRADADYLALDNAILSPSRLRPKWFAGIS
jgi:hypothetical protein